MIGVTSLYLDRVWDWYKDLIQKAIDHSNGENTIEDVYQKIKNKDMQLWVVGRKACLVTSIVTYPQKKACRIVYLAGEGMDEWLGKSLEVVEKWAKKNGCDLVEAYGRRGWVRAAKKHGYGESYTTVTKELS